MDRPLPSNAVERHACALGRAQLRELGVAAVFTPKDFGLNEIMGRFLDIIRDNRGLPALETADA